jgi:hypothetical protein
MMAGLAKPGGLLDRYRSPLAGDRNNSGLQQTSPSLSLALGGAVETWYVSQAAAAKRLVMNA